MKLKSFITGPAQAAFGRARKSGDAGERACATWGRPFGLPRLSPRVADPATGLARRPKIDTHLAVQATARSADLASVEVRFGVFRSSNLLFTRADEAPSFGPAFGEMVRKAKPIWLLTTGQPAPEDVAEAAKARVVELVLQRNSGSAAFAAGSDCGR